MRGVDSVKNRLFKSMVVYLIWLVKLYCNTLQANGHPPDRGGGTKYGHTSHTRNFATLGLGYIAPRFVEGLVI